MSGKCRAPTFPGHLLVAGHSPVAGCRLYFIQRYNAFCIIKRKHNYLLPLRTGRLSDHNFIQRMLYLDAY